MLSCPKNYPRGKNVLFAIHDADDDVGKLGEKKENVIKNNGLCSFSFVISSENVKMMFSNETCSKFPSS